MKKQIDYNDIYANSERHIKKAVAYSRNKKREDRVNSICEYFEKAGCKGVQSEKEHMFLNMPNLNCNKVFCLALMRHLSYSLAIDEMHLNDMKKEVPDI